MLSFTLLIGAGLPVFSQSKILILYKLNNCIRALFINPAIFSPRRQPYKHITQRRRSSLFVYIFHIYYCYSPKDYSQPPPKICFHLFWYCELIQIIMDETFLLDSIRHAIDFIMRCIKEDICKQWKKSAYAQLGLKYI